MKDFFEMLAGFGVIVVFFILLLIPIMLPLVYLEGLAKQQILKEVHGIEMNWLKASCVQVDLHKQDVVLEKK